MARRRSSGIDIFMILPWWVSGIAAVVSYVLMAFLVPRLLSGSQDAAVLINASTTLAPFVALGCAVIAAGSAIRSALVARRFNQQTGIADIRKLSWQQFEMAVRDAFRRRGYAVIESQGAGTDDAVDLVLLKDDKKYLVQCKQSSTYAVGVKPIRELFGAMTARQAAGGIFVHSGTYTTDARAFAAEHAIQLVDGSELEKMVHDQQAQPFIEPTNFGMRSNTTFGMSNEGAPDCPLCGKVMVLRAAKRGAKAGSQFWSCSGYPACRGARDV